MVRNENGRDAKGFAELAFHNKGGLEGSSRITAGFKCGADAA